MSETEFQFDIRFEPPLCIPPHAQARMIGDASRIFEGELPPKITVETVTEMGELVAVGTYALTDIEPRGLYKLESGTAYQAPEPPKHKIFWVNLEE